MQPFNILLKRPLQEIGIARRSVSKAGIHCSRFNFFKKAEIWYSRSGEAPSGRNTITVSDEFCCKISGHPIPADLEAINVFGAAPALLRLFMWLRYRCFVAKGPESIPHFCPFGLAQQLGCVAYSRPSCFRGMLEQWLQTIRALWPEFPGTIRGNGRVLWIASIEIDEADSMPEISGMELEERSGHKWVPGVGCFGVRRVQALHFHNNLNL